ncbi:hypothetical protein K432DRAFT_378648, partial [Lepidopterella palustris CBS 459.81]
MRCHGLTFILLFILVTVAIYIKLFAPLSSFSGPILSSLAHLITSKIQPSPCAPNIPQELCCTLLIQSGSCRQECMQRYLDRETLHGTAQYQLCEDGCLDSYEDECGIPRGQSWENRTWN